MYVDRTTIAVRRGPFPTPQNCTSRERWGVRERDRETDRDRQRDRQRDGTEEKERDKRGK